MVYAFSTSRRQCRYTILQNVKKRLLRKTALQFVIFVFKFKMTSLLAIPQLLLITFVTTSCEQLILSKIFTFNSVQTALSKNPFSTAHCKAKNA